MKRIWFALVLILCSLASAQGSADPVSAVCNSKLPGSLEPPPSTILDISVYGVSLVPCQASLYVFPDYGDYEASVLGFADYIRHTVEVLGARGYQEVMPEGIEADFSMDNGDIVLVFLSEQHPMVMLLKETYSEEFQMMTRLVAFYPVQH